MSHEKLYRLDLGDRAYDIHIEAGSLCQLGYAMRARFPKAKRCMIVSNTVVAPLYLAQVEGALHEANWDTQSVILPDGEVHKNMTTWTTLMDALMASKLSRTEPVIALGGGVIGDMVGFAASCYRRGIPFVQVPTTLLAQVDSSVGGKTAINHPHGKNMIGAFYQPQLVWIDPCVLQTLAIRELRAGIAELIKYGLIRDAEFFAFLQRNMKGILSLDATMIADVIYHSCRHKAEVVMADETEQGERALLNLGHTFGHAIESMTHYQRYLHGEAVALGTIMAARLSEQLGFAESGLEMRIRALYRNTALDVEIPTFTVSEWLDAMGHDKKNVGSTIRYILLREVGVAFVCDSVCDADIDTLVQSFQ
ncbi:MAG: 3-dehydroquinate synthase [Zetaproteobacteria bacterium]|nr:3-dehydroquinate synthase [Zetaproteobacteria bacterium]